MERVMKKLNSRRGASILLAMALILTALMVSAVIVSAALTAAHRVSQDRKEEQKTFALNSAARAMKGYLETEGEVTYQYYEETTDYAGYTTQNGVNTASVVMKHVMDHLPGVSFDSDPIGTSVTLTDPVVYTLTTNVTLPTGLTVSELKEPMKMELTVNSVTLTGKSEDGSETEIMYPFTGTVYCVGDGTENSQKLYVSGSVVKNVTITTRTDTDYPPPVPNPAHETNPDAPETIDPDPVDFTVTTTTTTWSMAGIRLKSVEP